MKNPVDLGALGFIVDVFVNCIKIVVNDPNIDIIVIPLWAHFIYNHVFRQMIEIQKSTNKPFMFCLPSIADSSELANQFSTVKKKLHEERVLYFFSLIFYCQKKTPRRKGLVFLFVKRCSAKYIFLLRLY